jgi:hypothetical protein
MRERIERHLRSLNLETRKRHLEINHHVMDRDRVRVVRNVQPRRFLIANGSPYQYTIWAQTVRPHSIFALVKRRKFSVVRED